MKNITNYELQILIEKIQPSGINILQIDNEANKAKCVEFQEQLGRLGGHLSHGFGALKLLAILPEITQKALVAGLAREKENVK